MIKRQYQDDKKECAFENAIDCLLYSELKELARQKAIEWQITFSEGKTYYWSEIAYFVDYFTKLAKRYGLVREFRENGII